MAAAVTSQPQRIIIKGFCFLAKALFAFTSNPCHRRDRISFLCLFCLFWARPFGSGYPLAGGTRQPAWQGLLSLLSLARRTRTKLLFRCFKLKSLTAIIRLLQFGYHLTQAIQQMIICLWKDAAAFFKKRNTVFEKRDFIFLQKG